MRDETLEDLNTLLDNELTARNTYGAALKAVTADYVTKVLESNRQSHNERATHLQDSIKKLEGKTTSKPDVWGAFTNLLGASMSEKAAVEVLAAGEERELANYKAMLDKRGSSALVGNLISKQEETVRAISELKKKLD